MNFRKSKILPTLALTAVFSAICFALVPISEDYSTSHIEKVVDQFDNYTQKTLKDWNAPGLAVAIVSQDNIHLLKGYGVREDGTEDPITSETIFRIASISKAFTAELTVLLAEDNIVNLDKPIQTYLPNINFSLNPNLTIRNILSMSSGYKPFEFTSPLESGIPYKTIIKELNHTTPISEPGKVFAYQNTIYCLAANAVEARTKKPFFDTLKVKILQPLGMHNTTCTFKDFETSKNRATPHNLKNGKYIPQTLQSSYYEVAPAGGINSSVQDLSRWVQAQLGGFPKIVPTFVRETVFTAQINNSAEIEKSECSEPWRKERLKRAAYGMGWRLYDYENHFIVGHSGHVNGVRHFLAFDPHRDIGIVILVNSDTPISGILLAKFFDLYYKLPEKDWSTLALNKLKIT